jgi:gamma-glutamylcyclotransferase (GGCT)/AIG2-like uncharacterized protein YtfP
VDRDGGEVHGEVLRLLQPEVSFSWLDAYEGIVHSADASNEYRREIHPVSLAAGATIEAWVYVYNCAPPLSARITSGRWAG